MACKALSIALEHLMVPRLDWQTGPLEEQLPNLREEIITSRIQRIETTSHIIDLEEKQRAESWLRNKLQNEPHFLDQSEVELIEQTVLEINPEDLIPPEPEAHVSLFYTG